MKLRLDRVLKVDLSALSKDEVMSAGECVVGLWYSHYAAKLVAAVVCGHLTAWVFD
jgi:hypothetical protein